MEKKVVDVSIKRPRGFVKSKTYKQLGILVLDGSGSMEEECLGNGVIRLTKGEAVSIATCEFFERIADSTEKKNFCFSVVYYDTDSKLRMDITDAEKLKTRDSYNPVEGMGGGTYISEGLKKAHEVANRFLTSKEDSQLSKSVIIIVMSDGVDMRKEETRRVAEDLKKNENIQLATCFFETLGADEDAMRECQEYMKALASKPNLYKPAANAEDLRAFFMDSMAVASPAKII